MSTFTGKTIILTGANRGIGKALLDQLLEYHQPQKIFATVRDISTVQSNEIVEPIELDITKPDEVLQLGKLGNIDILINNAGVFDFALPMPGDRNMAVNYYGTINVTETVIPVIPSGGGIITISSIIGLAPMKQAISYSASKAAIHSYIQAKRQQLESKSIFVTGVYPGAIDTDMTKGMDVAKGDVVSTAKNILQGYENEEIYIFPDPMSRQLGEAYLSNVVSLEASLNS